jgi:hypothetical protein
MISLGWRLVATIPEEKTIFEKIETGSEPV